MHTPETSNLLGQRFMDALHGLEQQGDRGIDAMAGLFAADATIANSALELSGIERRGSEGVRAFWADYVQSLPGASTEFHAVTRGSDAIGLFWTTQLPSANAGAGEPARYEGATLLRLDAEGQRIASMRGYYDTRALTSATQPETVRTAV